ncbi:proline dehydrogenase family protein [Mycobacterium sp. WUMAC-067]|uniref:proline dehydrogenase family protein n=1 Tax=unclassified Mycobacterium TaxID=2642494 RepID=UPI001CDA1415|nr:MULTISPECIES: proline dehydrogenase family protein [unclassified Mycobacterium]MCA2242629.1 proline dehydrogenase family protein [Mycobacterium sp. WUMAC-067]MCA2317246.1 proline dehydrogenase family protein [Mycobacterium sp. WUMAC-025]
MAGLFASTLRPVLLAAGQSEVARRAAERLPVTRRVVRRFVPGETIESALDRVATLRSSALFVSVDYLGEDVLSADDADAAVRTYLDLIEQLGRLDAGGDVTRPLEVSVKLSALGQAVERDGPKIARENGWSICDAARRAGVWVTVDAENHTTTESTLSIVRDLRADFPWLGVALQAYLRRTPGDCEAFAASGARVRLCKGAYDEPTSVAYREPAEVTEAYLRCLRVLMAGSGYPMVASHDPAVINAAGTLARESGCGAGEFEYQMLYGIRDDEQRRLTAAGNHVRVYLPFGTQWYGYFMRRLAERPANLTFFLRALVGR